MTTDINKHQYVDKEEVLSSLDKKVFYEKHVQSLKVFGRGSEAIGLCPLHDDSSPSLSVNLETGLWNCFAECGGGDLYDFYMRLRKVNFPTALNEIAASQGIRLSSKMHEVVALFRYEAPDGGLLYLKERLEPGREGRSKEFRFINNKGGGKEYKRGNKPVLYNLPAVLKASAVFVVEGEAKADLLNKWGFTTTCLDSGASSPWKEHYLEAFKGKRKVFILPDNDKPGMDYALRIAEALFGTVPDFRVVVLPGLEKGEDIIDWAEIDGNNGARLMELVENVPMWSPQEGTTFIDDVEEDEVDTRLDFPEDAWRGIFDAYRKAMDGTTSASDVAHFVTLWATIAVKLNRRVWFSYGMELFPNGQFVYFGETGDKKTTATKRSIPLIEDDKSVNILQGIGSGEGLAQWLATGDPSTSHFLYLSELSELLKRGSWEKSTLKDVITNLYDCPSTYEVPLRKNPIKIDVPTLTLLACTTTTHFRQDFSDSDLGSGFANRMLFMTGSAKKPIAIPKPQDNTLLDDVKASVDEALNGLPADPVQITLDAGAEELWESFYQNWHNKEWSPLVKPGLTRIDSYILKLAMVYSVIEGTVPYIRKDQLTAAIKIGEYSAHCIERLIIEHLGRSKTVELEEKIIERLKKRNMTRRELQRSLGSNIPSQTFNRALDEMKKAHRIFESQGRRKDQLIYSLKPR